MTPADLLPWRLFPAPADTVVAVAGWTEPIGNEREGRWWFLSYITDDAGKATGCNAILWHPLPERPTFDVAAVRALIAGGGG